MKTIFVLDDTHVNLITARNALSEQYVEIIKGDSAKLFDPELVNVNLLCEKEVIKIYE